MKTMWFDILIVVCFIAYGIKFIKNTPPYGDKQGFNTKYTKLSEAAWNYGHRFVGIYCVASGVVIGARTAFEYFYYGDNVPGPFLWISYAVEVLLVALAIPATNMAIKKKFGK